MFEALRQIHHKIDKNYVKFRLRGAPRPFQKVSIFIDTNRYVLKTVQSLDELHTALRLRYEIFIREALGKKWPIRIDIDHFDTLADHLVVVHKESNEIVGTYRLLSSHITDQFYSETEFDLSHFLRRDDRMLELGRACIHPDHRSGLTLALLWKGIRQYMEQSRTELMFGCSSLKSESTEEAVDLAIYLRSQDFLYRDHVIQPLPEFRRQDFRTKASRACQELDTEQLERGEKLVPTLLKSYIKAGAKVVFEPAFDDELKCFDFFTILDIKHLDAKYSRYFSR